MINRLFIISVFLSTSLLKAEPAVSNAELSRKLDSIVGKVYQLERRIQILESENKEVKKDIRVATQSANEAKSASKHLAVSADNNDKPSFLKNLRNQLRSDEAKSQGPWTSPETWNAIRKNLTAFQVRKILGNPNDIKKSTNPRIESVYQYTGDLDADGQEEKGIINFYRDRVISFDSPF